MASMGLPFTDPSQACQLAPALEHKVHAIGARIQKLERSRGQISKDISDMLNETFYLQRRAGMNTDNKKQVPVAVAEAPEPRVRVDEEPAEPPPGLGTARRSARIKTAPPSLPRVPEDQEVRSKGSADDISPPPGLGPLLPESLSVHQVEVDGKKTSRVEWRIDNAKAKFKDYVGRPLVSPLFEAAGLPELRLMVNLNLGLDGTGLSMREQKSRYEARIAEGPLNGSLKLKVGTNFGDKLVISFTLFVGGVVRGPLERNFQEHVMHGEVFDNNWLDEIKSGALVGCRDRTGAGQQSRIACKGKFREQCDTRAM